MKLFEPIVEIEEKEAQLMQLVSELSAANKKLFYKAQLGAIKDPDTYATLNWFFLGGIHHIYLGKYRLFIIELMLLITSISGWFLGFNQALFILLALALYELPQLFFSQKIVRQYNYQVSKDIYQKLKK